MTIGLRQHGANVITVDELDPAIHAATSNRHDASVYVGFESRVEEAADVTYYSTSGFESAGGRALARNLVVELTRIGGLARHAPMGSGSRCCGRPG